MIISEKIFSKWFNNSQSNDVEKNLCLSHKICLIFFLIFNLVFMVFWCNQKQGWFVDEGLTFQQSNSVFPFVPMNRILCQDDNSFFETMFTVQENQRFAFDAIQENLITHPPFYYFIFHSISSLFPDTFPKWIGLGLNLVIFLLTQLTLYALSRCFLSNKKAFLPILLYGFSVPAICTVVFIRSYMLFTLETTLLCLLAVNILNAQKSDNQKKFKINTFLFFVLLFSGCLTHYYFIITAFFVCAVLCFILLKRKEIKKLVIFSVGSLLYVGMCPILFPKILKHIFDSEQGVNNAIMPVIWDRDFSLLPWNDFINKNFFVSVLPYEFNWSVWVFGAIFIFGIFCLLRKKINSSVALLTATIICSVLIISFIQSLQVDRYFIHLVPLIVLLFVIFICALFRFIKNADFILPLFVVIMLCVLNLRNPNLSPYLYNENTEKGKFAKILKDKTLYINWLYSYESWKMVVPSLYSYSAKKTLVFFEKDEDCFKNLLNDENKKKSAALIAAYMDEGGCENFDGWDIFFNDDITCFYLPKENINGENNDE